MKNKKSSWKGEFEGNRKYSEGVVRAFLSFSLSMKTSLRNYCLFFCCCFFKVQQTQTCLVFRKKRSAIGPTHFVHCFFFFLSLFLAQIIQQSENKQTNLNSALSTRNHKKYAGIVSNGEITTGILHKDKHGVILLSMTIYHQVSTKKSLRE